MKALYRMKILATLCTIVAICVLIICVTSLQRDRDQRGPLSKFRTLLTSVKLFSVLNNRMKGKDTLQSTSNLHLRIIVITFNRAESLSRLLYSLNQADYDGDNIQLEIWIDRSKNGDIDAETLHVVDGFHFRSGNYEIYLHPRHAGLYGQWMKTWQPSHHSSEIAIILEDDLTVSPYFYKYLKFTHAKYASYPKINGFALQGLSIKHSENDQSLLQGPENETVFLYPVIGTWGFSPKLANWMAFLTWYNCVSQNTSYLPLVPGNVASSWFRTFDDMGEAESMWEMWHIHYAWKHSEFTLYPNFKDHIGLTANWMEKGLHYTGESVQASNPLLTEWQPRFERLPDRPVKLDINGMTINGDM